MTRTLLSSCESWLITVKFIYKTTIMNLFNHLKILLPMHIQLLSPDGVARFCYSDPWSWYLSLPVLSILVLSLPVLSLSVFSLLVIYLLVLSLPALSLLLYQSFLSPLLALSTYPLSTCLQPTTCLLTGWLAVLLWDTRQYLIQLLKDFLTNPIPFLYILPGESSN